MSRISPHALIAALIVLALLDASYAGALYWREARANPATLSLWNLIFLSVTVWWIDADSRRHAGIYRPFEFG
jgi:hypothetical protein